MAAALSMPEGQLALRRRPDVEPPPSSKPTQVMHLPLGPSNNTHHRELLEALRDGQKARLRLGKHPSLHYGSKSHALHAGPQLHRSELYASSPSTDRGSLYFTGVLSHSLEVQEAKEATAASDEALANLEQRLNAFEKGKESRKTPLISSIDEMKALRAGDNRSATGKQAASLTRMSTSRIDLEKERFFKNATHRSSPASPALRASSRSPQPAPTSNPPTSHPPPPPPPPQQQQQQQQQQDKDKTRQDALRVPLIHLLAIRPASVKSLAQQTRSTRDDCLALIRKCGTENRHDRDKFDLRDKIYKELDVWNFPYPSQDDRQGAIENAISAFDRLRLSRQDKMWQMLLPKQERGKGKVLSRLNLSAGPIPKALTPRIQVQPSEEPSSVEGYGTGNESEPAANGGLTPGTETPGGGNQNTATQKAKPTEKRAPGKPKNTTLTGRVTKKAADKKGNKKAASKSDTKYKSAEFVVDSDEEDMKTEDPPATSSPAPPNIAKDIEERTEERAGATTSDKQEMKNPHSAQSSEEEATEPAKSVSATKAPPSKASQPAAAPPRAASSTSPQKPSPLGSSPPTNASDLEPAPRPSVTTAQSSSSSSPLLSQRSKRKEQQESSRKDADTEYNRAKPCPPSQTLKRKADSELDTAPTRPPPEDKAYGLGISNVNGHQRPESKRRRQSSQSSGGSSTGSSSPPISREILRQRLCDKSRLFKQRYAKYRALHAEMSGHPNPQRSRLEKLERQHARLEEMKQEIWDEDRRLRQA